MHINAHTEWSGSKVVHSSIKRLVPLAVGVVQQRLPTERLRLDPYLCATQIDRSPHMLHCDTAHAMPCAELTRML